MRLRAISIVFLILLLLFISVVSAQTDLYAGALRVSRFLQLYDNVPVYNYGYYFQQYAQNTADCLFINYTGAGHYLIRLQADGADVFTINKAAVLVSGGSATFADGADLNAIDVGMTAANEIDTDAGNLILDSATGTTQVDDALSVTGDLDAASADINAIDIGVAAANEIDTDAGNLVLDSFTGTTQVDDDLSVTGDLDAASADINAVDIGVSAANEIDTDAGNLVLDSFTGTTQVDDDLSVTGDLDAASADINAIDIGVAAANEIDTDAGNLILDSATGTTQVDDDLSVTGALDATSADINDIDIGVAAANEIDTDAGNLILDSATGTTEVDDALSVIGNVALPSISSIDDTSIVVSLGGDAGDDFTVDSTTLVVAGDTNNVGIGTATPDAAYALDVNGDLIINNTIKSSDGTKPILTLSHSAGVTLGYGTDSTVVLKPSFARMTSSYVDLQPWAASPNGYIHLDANSTIRNTGEVVWEPSATQVIDAVGDAILANATMTVLNPDGDYTLTSTPTVADGLRTGQMLIISCDNAEANTVTVQDQDTLAGSNLQLGANTRDIAGKDVLTLLFDGTDWIEMSYANN